MDIAPDYRGKGIASKVLEKVCDDAKNEGYLYVEAYPCCLFRIAIIPTLFLPPVISLLHKLSSLSSCNF